MENFDDML